MNTVISTTVVTLFLFISCTSAFPNAIFSLPEKMPDVALPENTMMGQSQNDLGIELCPDQLHLCPETADCCQKEDGKWDCCPEAVVPIILGECCHQFVYKWTCCNDTAPKCHYWGCRWS